MIAEHHDMDVTTFINEVHGDFRNYIDDDKLYAEYVAWWKRTHSKLGRALK